MFVEIVIAWLPLAVMVTAWVISAIYARRKQSRLASAKTDTSGGPVDTISIARSADATAIIRDFKVLIDGNLVGIVEAGETRHFKVAPGHRRVSVKIDWCESLPMLVEKKANQNLMLRCGARFNDWRCLVAPLIWPSQYLYISQP